MAVNMVCLRFRGGIILSESTSPHYCGGSVVGTLSVGNIFEAILDGFAYLDDHGLGVVVAPFRCFDCKKLHVSLCRRSCRRLTFRRIACSVMVAGARYVIFDGEQRIDNSNRGRRYCPISSCTVNLIRGTCRHSALHT